MQDGAVVLQQPVQERIEAAVGELSKKQRRVADWILANPGTALFATANDVAQQSGVDPATVVRFAQALRYAGYTELRDELRAGYPALRSLRSPLERLDEEVGRTGVTDAEQILERARAQTYANLELTFEKLDWRSVARCLDYFLAARRALVMAAGQSRALGVHLYRVLQTAQIPAQLVTDWYDLMYESATLGPADAMFGVTVWRYSKVTIEALRLAHEAGAKTMLLTDAPFAPGAEIADITLVFSPHAIGEFLSPAAGAAVIDCLAAGLAARIPDRVKRGMALQYEIGVAHGLNYH
jgi:DNA-binding MurR/RpiR family transcriptional regulator